MVKRTPATHEPRQRRKEPDELARACAKWRAVPMPYRRGITRCLAYDAIESKDFAEPGETKDLRAAIAVLKAAGKAGR